MEASALTHAGRSGLIARRSPLLRLQGDERLVAMLRHGNASAFDAIVDRYQARLLGFCRQMLGSTEDAEDVLQEVFVNAYRAMLADSREINLRPWLYRIARNRCLNHLRKPVPEGQDSMDTHPGNAAAATHERVQNREEFRQLLNDVGKLPETQRSALLLREMDALSYEEIAQAMETTVPSVKSLLVRARIALAEASQARQLTCGDVRLELAEAAEGLCKASGPVRRHVRGCERCGDFRSQLRTDSRALAAIFPAGPLLILKSAILSKLGFGGAGASSGAGAGAGAGSSAAIGGAGGAAGGVGGVGGMAGATLGAKAVAGVVTAAVLTAGAVEVKDRVVPSDPPSSPPAKVVAAPPAIGAFLAPVAHGPLLSADRTAPKTQPKAVEPATPAPAPTTAPATTPPPPTSTDAPQQHPDAGASTADSTTNEEGVAVVVSGGSTGDTTTTPPPSSDPVYVAPAPPQEPPPPSVPPDPATPPPDAPPPAS